jgi:hypothetical protein
VNLAAGAAITLEDLIAIIANPTAPQNTLQTLIDAHAGIAATTAISAHVELATTTEAQAGTDATRAVTPAGLAYAMNNVKYYGAVGDGVHDDTAAIQAAMNALSANGGTLFFSPGTYKVTLMDSGGVGIGISIPSNTCVEFDEGVTLSLATNSFDQYRMFYAVSGEHNITIRGGTLIGDVGSHTGATTGQAGYGLYFENGVRNITLQDMMIQKMWGDGIFIGPPKTGLIASISGNGTTCTVNTSVAHGLSNNDHVYIANTVNFDGFTGAITVTDADTFTFPHLTNATENPAPVTARFVYNNDNIKIEGCNLLLNRRQGMSVVSVTNLTIEKCLLENTGRAGVGNAYATYPASGIDLEWNFDYERKASGDIRIHDCTFRGNAGLGSLICMSRVKVERCRFERNATNPNLQYAAPNTYPHQLSILNAGGAENISDIVIEHCDFDWLAYDGVNASGMAIVCDVGNVQDLTIKDNKFTRPVSITDEAIRSFASYTIFADNRLNCAGTIQLSGAYTWLRGNAVPNGNTFAVSSPMYEPSIIHGDFTWDEGNYFQSVAIAKTLLDNIPINFAKLTFVDDFSDVVLKITVTFNAGYYVGYFYVRRQGAGITLTSIGTPIDSGGGFVFASTVVAPDITISVKLNWGVSLYGVIVIEAYGGGSDALSDRGFQLVKV